VDVAPPAPFVDVTNVVQTVNYNATTTAIGGSNSASIVTLWWSNSLTSAVGPLTLGTPWWTIYGISLAVGPNEIYVYGTNVFGAAVHDEVTITRRDVTTGTPLVDVTNSAQTVHYAVTTTAIGGSNNASVVALWWMNSLTSAGGAGSLGTPWWAISSVNLGVGLNTITVSGTNALGVLISDSVNITRGDVTTGMPFVDITNQIQQVNIISPFSVAGTNNLSVIGSMWISNAANGQSVSFPASQSWTSAAVTLGLITNTLYVFGSNTVGNVTNDTVVVIGVPEGALLAGLAALAALAARRRLRQR